MTLLVSICLFFLFQSSWTQGEEVIFNWYGDLSYKPADIVVFTAEENIVDVFLSPNTKYPVRPAGARHSMTPVEFHVQGEGTLLDMRSYNRIINIDTINMVVTAQAGALYIDVAKALEDVGMQFYVNVEIGTATLGGLVTGTTKDSSFPDEYGQVGSYATAVRLVKVDGTVIEVNEEAEPELMTMIRCSHGLLGVVTEVTITIKPIQSLAISHQVYSTKGFSDSLPSLMESDKRIMFYSFPMLDLFAVELSSYSNKPIGNDAVWFVRNLGFKTVTSLYGSRMMSNQWMTDRIKYRMIDIYPRILLVILRRLKSDSSNPRQQIIQYQENPGRQRYVFTFWAFPLNNATTALHKFVQFNKEHYRQTGFRTNMPAAGYIQRKADCRAHFSYSCNGSIISIDPVSSGDYKGDGWKQYLQAYNEFAITNNGIPMFNQSPYITPSHVVSAFGQSKIDQFEAMRVLYDPKQKLVNEYFRKLLGITPI